MRRRPGTIALILIGFVLAWHACAIGVGETRVANGWVGVLLRVALQSELPNTDSNSLRPPRAEAPAELHGPSPEIWAQYGPAGLPENESTQYGSRSFDLKTTPTRTDRPLEPSLQALDSPLRGSDDDGLVQNRTAILVPQQTPAAEAPIQIVAFSDSRFRPTNETWRGMLAVNPLPVDRVRPAIIPARYVANTSTAPWSHWGVPAIPSDFHAQLRVVPNRPHFFARWLAPLNPLGNYQLEGHPLQQHLPVTLKFEISTDWIQTLRGMQEAIDSSLKSHARIQPLIGAQDSP